jgi:hypothetical protein
MKHDTQSVLGASAEVVPERRTRTQASGPYWLSVDRWPTGTRGPGTIAWSEHEEIWRAYDAKEHNGQDAERIAERGGFGYWEAAQLLGHEPRTWLPLAQETGDRK